ncbi:MAG TPA: DUF2971 domain-containing protein [Acetobacteraceae bacterium]|nr:DUF2971 domain-containing protein [Acetobacteraceae bacterium]
MPLRLTIEATLKIADRDFLASHGELHHYTSFDALNGILSSNTLWATHFSYLNDTTEVTLLKRPLVDAVAAVFGARLGERCREDPRIARLVYCLGGREQVACREAKSLIEGLYQQTFSSPESIGAGEPFLVSFCTHAGDQAYERENGLLSQWRGYATGGCCIVFDTKPLAEMLGKEFDRYHYTFMEIAPVHYALEGVDVGRVFPDLVDNCVSFLLQALTAPGDPFVGDAFGLLLNGATHFKHQGFREEREVRIVAAAGSKALASQAEHEHSCFIAKPIKKVRDGVGQSGKKRYIALFEGMPDALPIKRLIVGPSPNQRANYERAHALVAGSIPLMLSETPFVG